MNTLHTPQFFLGTSQLIFNIKICEKTNGKVDSVLLISQVQPEL